VIENILSRLDLVKKSGKGYLARCPAHNDKSPSLSLVELPDGRILMKCFAECMIQDVLVAIGLSLSDLFPDGGLGHYQGFQQIQETMAARTQDKSHKDIIILEIAKSDRSRGKRLSQKELEVERQAFERVRNANITR